MSAMMLRATLQTVMPALLTAGLIVLPVQAHGGSLSSPPSPTLGFKATASHLPTFAPMDTQPTDWSGEVERKRNAAPILAPIGAFGAGMVVPTVLFVQDAMKSYEPYRVASGLHPAELEPRFHGSALVYSTIAVALAPAGAATFYVIGGGKVTRALGGGFFGLLFAAVGVPVGALMALTLTSPYQDNPEASPKAVYTTYALSMYGTTSAMSLVGFFVIGKKKNKKTTASFSLQPVRAAERVALRPTLQVRF